MAGPSSSLPALPSSSANAAASAIAPDADMDAGDGAEEEESGTNDEMDDDAENPSDEGPLTRLMNNLREQQNEALAFERFSDANEMQGGIMLVLNAARDGAGLTFEVVDGIQKCFKRLQRASRNRGEHWLSETHAAYAEDFQLLLT
eukprot:s491_g6.t1